VVDDPAPPWHLAEPVPLVLDESKLDEARLPVFTPDGPGVLWSNSG
jgi:hypothetical protein